MIETRLSKVLLLRLMLILRLRYREIEVSAEDEINQHQLKHENHGTRLMTEAEKQKESSSRCW